MKGPDLPSIQRHMNVQLPREEFPLKEAQKPAE